MLATVPAVLVRWRTVMIKCEIMALPGHVLQQCLHAHLMRR